MTSLERTMLKNLRFNEAADFCRRKPAFLHLRVVVRLAELQ